MTMVQIKSYADIEQSKKLAEILPIESADGFWEYHNKWYSEGDEWEGYEDYPRAVPYLEYTRKENEWKEDKSDIPCWSLARLLGILANLNCIWLGTDDVSAWRCVFNFGKGEHLETTEEYINPIDACVEMIFKLHKIGIL